MKKGVKSYDFRKENHHLGDFFTTRHIVNIFENHLDPQIFKKKFLCIIRFITDRLTVWKSDIKRDYTQKFP